MHSAEEWIDQESRFAALDAERDRLEGLPPKVVFEGLRQNVRLLISEKEEDQAALAEESVMHDHARAAERRQLEVWPGSGSTLRWHDWLGRWVSEKGSRVCMALHDGSRWPTAVVFASLILPREIEKKKHLCLRPCICANTHTFTRDPLCRRQTTRCPGACGASKRAWDREWRNWSERWAARRRRPPTWPTTLPASRSVHGELSSVSSMQRPPLR